MPSYKDEKGLLGPIASAPNAMTQSIPQGVVHRTGCLLVLVFVTLFDPPIQAAAQSTGQTTVRAEVGSVGEVLDVSLLTPGAREPTADLNVHGTVTVRHNGPHRLQVTLSEPFTVPGPGGSPVVNDVFARVDGGLILLDTDTWVTVATGPATPGLTYPVAYFVAWGRNAPRRPEDATMLPLIYRVVPPANDDPP